MSGVRSESRPQRDGSVIPRFHMEAVKDGFASREQGRDIFRDEERVQFIIPGRGDHPVAKVTDEHRMRWPEEYAAFKAGQEMSVTGIPLEEWAMLNRSQVLELKHLGCHTVEQVAGMSDNAIQKIGMAGMRLRELAKGYLDDAYAQKEQARLLAENEQLNGRIATLEAQLKELRPVLDKMHAQIMAEHDRPSAIISTAPMDMEMPEVARAVEAVAPSSLEMLGARGRRGRAQGGPVGVSAADLAHMAGGA